MGKNKQFILIVFLFLSLVLSNPLQAMGTSQPALHDDPHIYECNFQAVSRVIDGDTFELSDGKKVRLIGVDTPETLDPRKHVQWFGREASKKLKQWIDGQTVCLRKDRDKTIKTDKYGRLLRYVWKHTVHRSSSNKAGLAGGFFVNAELIKHGYGFAYTRYPFQYLELFRQYEKDARQGNMGLWKRDKQEIWEREVKKNRALAKTCGNSKTLCPEYAKNHIGKHKTVRFFIEKSYDDSESVFLNSKNNFKAHDNFTAVIFRINRNKFPEYPADFYWGKTVDITGFIKEYKGRAEIILKNNSQIKIVK